MSQFPFDLIHCDIWGPYHLNSHSGHRFFLTLVDDCTRFTWIFLLKQKSDVAQAIHKFFNFVLTQFDKRIKQFRFDNAKELAFTEFFNDKGVMHQFPCVETPQQNLVVERKHQHLLNVARALYFQSQVPLSFWTDCVLTATFFLLIEHLLQFFNIEVLISYHIKKELIILLSGSLDVLLLHPLLQLTGPNFNLEPIPVYS